MIIGSACRVWLTLSSCLHDVRVYCYVRHTHFTHCTTCDDSDDDNIELQLDLFCILTYEPSISHIDGPLTLEGNLRSNERRSIIGRSRRSSIDSSSGSDLLNVATFFANVSRSPFRVSLTDRHTHRQNIPNFA